MNTNTYSPRHLLIMLCHRAWQRFFGLNWYNLRELDMGVHAKVYLTTKQVLLHLQYSVEKANWLTCLCLDQIFWKLNLAEARKNSSTNCIKPQKTVVLFYSKLQLATQCLTLQTTDLQLWPLVSIVDVRQHKPPFVDRCRCWRSLMLINYCMK
jgi:hypothetical protein